MAFSEAIGYHDQYVDEVTQFKPSHMNLPIDQLDYQIGVNVTAIGKCVHVLASVAVDFSVVGETTLYTTISGETTVPLKAVVRAGGDAGATEVTIGRSGEVADFLNTQTLSNLNASGEMVILQPVPNATPVGLKSYPGGIAIRMNVETAEGVAINWVDLLGYTTDPF